MPFDPSKPFTVAFDPSAPVRKVSPGMAGEVSGAYSTLLRSIPFADETNDRIGAMVKTGTDLMRGRTSVRRDAGPVDNIRATFGDFKRNYDALQARTRNSAGDFKDRRPRLAALTEGLGLAAQVAPALATGGATAASPAVGRGLLGASARASVAGGLSAQAAGLGGDGTLRERVSDANAATLPAMAIGGALPVGMMAAGKGRRVVADTARGAARGTVRLANRATGGRVLDPQLEAARRMGEALRMDGLGPAEVRAALTEWQRSGASSPMLMNLAGENTRALLRAAAAKPGGARNLAVSTVNRVEADLQPEALARTRALTRSQAPAVRVAQELEDLQGRVADEMYPGPYATPAPVSDGVVVALQDEPGKAALRRARAAAVARRNPQQVAEIDALLRSEPVPDDAFDWYRPPPETVSGGTLDRVRIAMAGRGAKMSQSPDTRDIAGGLFSRASDIDAALDEIPGLQPARQTYRGLQASRDALDLGGSQPFNNPDQYADELARLREMATPDGNPYPVTADDITATAGIGLRSEMERMIGAPTEGATGTLNKLATGTNTGRVLEETYGPEAAGRYRDALGREIGKVADARFISPNTGPKSANVLLDQLAETPAVPTTGLGLAKMAFDKLRRGVSLTDAEREALVQLGTTTIRAADDLPRIPTTPQAMRLLTPMQRARISRLLSAGEGARQGSEDARANPPGY